MSTYKSYLSKLKCSPNAKLVVTEKQLDVNSVSELLPKKKRNKKDIINIDTPPLYVIDIDLGLDEEE